MLLLVARGVCYSSVALIGLVLLECGNAIKIFEEYHCFKIEFSALQDTRPAVSIRKRSRISDDRECYNTVL